MPSKLPHLILLSLFGLIVFFHLGILVKWIPYTIAWGGRLSNDSEMYGFETISIVLNAVIILVLLMPVEQFTLLINALNQLPLSYLHLMNAPFPAEQFPHYPTHPISVFGNLSKHPVIANFGYTRESGEAALNEGPAQFIAYGSLFLANPDLPQRFALNAPLNQPDRATMYGGQDKGYIDYPFLNP